MSKASTIIKAGASAFDDIVKKLKPKERKILFAGWNSQYGRGLTEKANSVWDKALNNIANIDAPANPVVAANEAYDTVSNLAEGLAKKLTGKAVDTMPTRLNAFEAMNRMAEKDIYTSPQRWMAPAHEIDDVAKSVIPGLTEGSGLLPLEQKLLTEPTRMLELYRRQPPEVRAVLDKLIMQSQELKPMDFLVARRIASGS